MYGVIDADPDGRLAADVATPALALSAKTIQRLTRMGASFDVDQNVIAPDEGSTSCPLARPPRRHLRHRLLHQRAGRATIDLAGWRTVSARYFRRRWEEPRGDRYDAWGHSTWYFETGTDGWPTRQIEVYDAGPTLRYGPDLEEDEYGGLGLCQLDELEDWTPWAITADDFEAAWNDS